MIYQETRQWTREAKVPHNQMPKIVDLNDPMFMKKFGKLLREYKANLQKTKSPSTEEIQKAREPLAPFIRTAYNAIDKGYYRKKNARALLIELGYVRESFFTQEHINSQLIKSVAEAMRRNFNDPKTPIEAAAAISK